jgi:hypothetical protein
VDPDALLHPVGPQSPRVYWLRRLALLVLLLVLVVGLVKACSGGAAEPDRVTSGPQPSATTSSAPSTGKPPRCSEDTIEVAATADAETYPADVLPHLSAEVRNISDEPCRLASEEAARSWSVLSGDDEIWTTTDCEHPRNRVIHRLGAGKAITYSVVWDRHRSIDGCAEPGDEAQPGTYRLFVSVDGVDAKRVIFHLTD